MTNACTLSRPEILQTLNDLLRTAQTNDLDNRRSANRFPFYQPVSVSPGLDGKLLFSAFSRDISETGIGLLHHMPLEGGNVRLKIERPNGNCIVPAKIVWCRPAGAGWYMSGAVFIDIVLSSAADGDRSLA